MSSNATIDPPTGGFAHTLTPGTAQLIACAIATTTIATIFLGLRIYTRARLRVLGKEDWLMVSAVVFSWANSGLNMYQAHIGLGRHMYELDEESKTYYMKISYSAMICYNIAIFLVKLSVIFLYMRLFNVSHMRQLCRGVLYITVVASLSSLCLKVFMCTPIRAYWELHLQGAVCLNRRGIWLAASAVQMITDILIFFLPMPAIYRMNLPRPQKMGLLIPFGLGLVVPIISTVRLSALVEILGTKDPSYDGIHIMEWSQIEINIAIIAACLAVLRPFVARLFPSLVNPPSGRDNYHGAVPRSPATARRRSMMMRLQSTSQSQTRASGPELDISLHMHDVEATPVVAGSSEKDSWNGNEVR